MNNNDKRAVERHTEKEPARRKARTHVTLLALVLAPVFSFGPGCNSNKSDSTTKPDATPTTSSAERMVLDNEQVTVHVECTNREYRQYKFRFIVKKPWSPLIAPIVRMAGNPDVHSVFVNGVDSDNVGFAFSPNIAVVSLRQLERFAYQCAV